MRRLGKIMVAMLGLGMALAPSLVSAGPPTPHIYGPAPDWTTFRRLAEQSVAAQLLDPESARFSWTTGYYKGDFKPFLSPRVAGYVACGLVNAKNQMGGYSGYGSFVAVIDNDRVLYADVDHGSGVGLVGSACIRAKQQGLFPQLTPEEMGADLDHAAPSEGRAGSPPDAVLTSAGTGLTLRAMPEGAYVTGVQDGSVAAAANIKPGMVITMVNGVALTGLSDAAPKVVDAAGPTASLTLVGGTVVKLGGKR